MPPCDILSSPSCSRTLKLASNLPQRFLRQKSKIEWLEVGDSNTAFFHKSVKSRNARNRIEMIRDAYNVLHQGAAMVDAFVTHYENFLGNEGVTDQLNSQHLFVRTIDIQKSAHMIRDVTDDEIKNALYSMKDDKAPGLDGFTGAFFKKAWDIVGTDFIRAIKEFFLNVEFSYNNSYHSSVRCDMFEALYGRKCRSSIMWVKVREGQLIGHELVQETTEKILQIKNRLKVARDHQKRYADKRMKPLKFSVGDYVLLKVLPWKGVVRFKKKGKLAPRFVGPFKIIEKKCLADPTLQAPLYEIRVDARLNFMEEPIEILEREFKKLKRSRIAIVKVWWDSKRGLEFTWEHEDQMKLKYPPLFSAGSS
nr:putative reverse transcriptase domain-containing protein [Tanacetum cinerariifolium]